jgi:hypothetical protein
VGRSGRKCAAEPFLGLDESFGGADGLVLDLTLKGEESRVNRIGLDDGGRDT